VIDEPSSAVDGPYVAFEDEEAPQGSVTVLVIVRRDEDDIWLVETTEEFAACTVGKADTDAEVEGPTNASLALEAPLVTGNSVMEEVAA